MSHWLALEAVLLQRLRDKLPRDIAVLSATDLAGVVENSQATPAVQIYHRGYRIVEEQQAGVVQRVEQTWLAVVVVRNAAGQRDGQATRADAGEICDAVFEALLGFMPPPPFSALKLANAPEARWSKGGFGYYPLAFTTRLTVRGQPNHRSPHVQP